MENEIQKLAQIDKCKLSEREFVEKVLAILVEMRKKNQIIQNEEQISQILEKIGCIKNVKEWLKEQKEKGVMVNSKMTKKEGCECGDFVTGLNLVYEYMKDPFTAFFVMTETEHDEMWIEASKDAKDRRELPNEKKQNILERIYKLINERKKIKDQKLNAKIKQDQISKKDEPESK